MQRRICWIFAIPLLLTACASAYEEDGLVGGFNTGGYSDKRIDQNTVIVSFDGNSFTPHNTVMSYLIFRCAEITLADGFDYFVVTAKNTSPFDVNVKTVNDYHNYTTYPPKLYTTYPMSVKYQSSRVSVTNTTPYALTGAPPSVNTHGATAVIKMFQGSIPPGLPNAYDAKDVMAHLEPNTF